LGSNPAEALTVYAELSGLLRETLGVSPIPRTRALYKQLLAPQRRRPL
jgi:DNA-binding SARP family transcriptional activator